MSPILILNYMISRPDKIKSKIFLFAGEAKFCRLILRDYDQLKLEDNQQEIDKRSKQSFLSFNLHKCLQMTLLRKSNDKVEKFEINGKDHGR